MIVSGSRSRATAQATDGVSVIIPTYCSDGYLPALFTSLLNSLGRLSIPSEIIVVDTSPQGSPSHRVTQQLCGNFGVLFIHGTWRSVARSRNEGANSSQYSILFFIDSDCQPELDTIDAHLRFLAKSPFAAGTIGVTHLTGQMSIACRAIMTTSFVLGFKWAAFWPTVPWGPTCNLAVRRAVYDAVKGFDEDFHVLVGGEDVDFCWRAAALGFVWVSVPQATMRHTTVTWNGFRVNLRRVFRYGVADYYLLKKHVDKCFWEPIRYPTFWFLSLLSGILLTKLGDVAGALWTSVLDSVLALILIPLTDPQGGRCAEPIHLRMLGETYVAAFDMGHFITALLEGDLKRTFQRVRHARGQVIDSRRRQTVMLGILFSVSAAALVLAKAQIL